MKQRWLVVTSVQEHVATVAKGVHMKCANIHVVDCSFVHIVVKPSEASLALRATENLADDALMVDVQTDVRSRVSRANNLVHGIVLIISAIVFVARNVIGLTVMLPAPKSSLATTRVLVYVERTFLPSVLFVTQKSCLLC